MDEFLQDLKALLEKHQASIDSSSQDYGMWGGVSYLTVEVGTKTKRFFYLGYEYPFKEHDN